MSPSHRSVGDGDNCPLFKHGPMIVVPGSHPPKQYCPDQMHDGALGDGGTPPSRQFWPLYGFDESVKAYLARLDKAIRESGLPDLSDVEVQ